MERFNEAAEKIKAVDAKKTSNEDKLASYCRQNLLYLYEYLLTLLL